MGGLRPTSERIRETLFNWLAPTLSGASCLDLFAGTGALGIEALSRGAGRAVFVEKSPVAARTLKANLELLEAGDATVFERDAMEFLKSGSADRYDIVFLDPPFAEDMLGELCRLLAGQELLAPNASVYIEQARSKPQVEMPQGWQVIKNKTAGNVRYMLVRKTD